MAANEIHIGDIGTVFEMTLMDGDVVVDISSAVAAGTKKIIFQKPDLTVAPVEVEASFTTDGTDGKIQYITPDVNFLDVSGTWKIQGRVTLSTGTWSSDISKFKVYTNLL